MKIIYIRANLNYSTLQIHSYTKQKNSNKKIKIEKKKKTAKMGCYELLPLNQASMNRIPTTMLYCKPSKVNPPLEDKKRQYKAG